MTDDYGWLSEDEVKNIVLIRIICSGISIVGCLFIISLYIVMCVKFRCFKKSGNGNNSNSNYNSSNTLNNNSTINIDTEALLNSSSMTRDSVLLEQSYNNKNKKLALKSCRTVKSTTESGRKKMGIGNDLIFCLILSNLGWCIGSFLGMDFYSAQDRSNPLCIAQAFIQNFFDMSVICWTTLISRVTILGTKKVYADIRKMKVKMYLYFLYGYICPFLFSIGPYLTNSYGWAGAWCWIDLYKPDAYDYFWITSNYIFNWLNLFYIFYALIAASIYFSKRHKEIMADSSKYREQRFLNKYIVILRIFPIVLMITHLPGVANRCYSLFTASDSHILFICQSVAISLSGFFNSLLYSYFYRSVFKKENDNSNTPESGSDKVYLSTNINSNSL
jgi:hypothetical protein